MHGKATLCALSHFMHEIATFWMIKLLYAHSVTLCMWYIVTSDVFELEIGELSRAEPSWIFPSRAELVGFRNRAEPSWIFLETSWIFLGNHFFVSNKFIQKVLYGHKFQDYWCFWSIVLSDFLLYQINKGIKSNFDNVLLFLTIFHHASWIFSTRAGSELDFLNPSWLKNCPSQAEPSWKASSSS